MKTTITIKREDWKEFVKSLDFNNIETQLENSKFWENHHGYQNRNSIEQSRVLEECYKAIAEFHVIRNKIENLFE
jgi:hypothetical protein